MKKRTRTVVGYFVLCQPFRWNYYYLENDLFAPSADYDIVSNTGSSSSSGTQGNESAFADVQVKGRAYYSHDYQYMADVSADSVTIYHAGDLDNPQEVELKGQGVSSVNGSRAGVRPDRSVSERLAWRSLEYYAGSL